jgi:hypothetical protein
MNKKESPKTKGPSPQQDNPNLGVDVLKRFVKLEKARLELEEEIKDIKSLIQKIQSPLIAWFERTGMERVTIDGRTVFARTIATLKRHEDVSKEELCDALLKTKFAYLVNNTFNTLSLNSALREHLDKEENLPEELRHVLTLGSVTTITSRSS